MRSLLLPLVAALALATAGASMHGAAAQSVLKDAGSLLKGLGGGGSGLTDAEVAGGLKDALRVGTETVTGNLGARDGFLKDPVAHIPLPGYMQTAQKVLRLTGQAELLDEIETRMNRAAEASMDEAKSLFGDAIAEMTFDDAREILTGPDDSATRYFESKMSEPLSKRMRPIVKSELEKTDAIALYDEAAAANSAAGLGARGKTMMINHAVDGALKGLFHYVAEEEAAIRNDPAKRVTPLLQKVFR